MGKPVNVIKHADLLQKLHEFEVYSSASIARYGQKIGYYKGLKPEELKTAMRRTRHCLLSFASNHLPPEGDGSINIKGQQETVGWYGWRWKYATTTLGEINDN